MAPLKPYNRFANKISFNLNGCWIWEAGKSQGYGMFWYNGRTHYAHRWIYSQAVSSVHSDLHIDHLCRNRACVNPDHLEPVTMQENLRRGLPTGGDHGQQSNKTHCPKGHEYNEINTRRYNGQRICRACDKERKRRERA